MIDEKVNAYSRLIELGFANDTNFKSIYPKLEAQRLSDEKLAQWANDLTGQNYLLTMRYLFLDNPNKYLKQKEQIADSFATITYNMLKQYDSSFDDEALFRECQALSAYAEVAKIERFIEFVFENQYWNLDVLPMIFKLQKRHDLELIDFILEFYPILNVMSKLTCSEMTAYDTNNQYPKEFMQMLKRDYPAGYDRFLYQIDKNEASLF